MVTAEQARKSLLDMLRRRSFERRPVVLSSGKSSNFYIDCKQTTLNGLGHVYVGRCLLTELQAYESRSQQTIRAVGGLTLGADPIISAVSMTAALEGRDLPGFIVRKEAKGHGTGAYLEGVKHLELGPVAIVEDVMTTGASSLKAIERTRAAGYTVSVVLGLVDRMEGARERLEAEAVEVLSLFTKEDFIDELEN